MARGGTFDADRCQVIRAGCRFVGTCHGRKRSRAL